MDVIDEDQPQAAAVTEAIRAGAVEVLTTRLSIQPGLAQARILDGEGVGRTLLHVATDWPGHWPNVARTIHALVDAGADVDAPVTHPDGRSPETALHWAASADDVVALDALLDRGANIEAPGAVITGGTAMSDAVIFRQWAAARRLLERGATTTYWQAAGLGLTERVIEHLTADPDSTPDDVTNAFWNACRGGQRETAERLLAFGPRLTWVGPDGDDARAAAAKGGCEEVVAWLDSVRAGRG